MDEDLIMNTYAIQDLVNLPELFESPEELYIMLLDLVYTERFSCLPQYSAIVSYCMESNFLVDIQSQLQKFVGSFSPQQFLHGCLLCIITLFANKKYEEARDFSCKLINDIQTQIQDFQLDQFLYQYFHVQLQMLKVFKQKPKNATFYVNLLQIMKSITEEALNDYVAAEASIAPLATKDLSIGLSHIRLLFNSQYQSISGFSVPMFSYGKQQFEKIMNLSYQILQGKAQENSIFGYEPKLIKFVGHLYCARIRSLLGDYLKANEHFIELWQLSPDDESYEESIAIYLDNFVRYAFGEKGDLSLLTKSPIYYVQNPRRLNLDVVTQAIETASQYSEMANVNIKVVAFYYLAIFNTLQQNYEKTISYLKSAKEFNEQQYKYPSEMVTLTYLPQMIDFDILSSLVMLGDASVCNINLPNYFSDLLQQKSILLELSQDRKSLCMPLQCMLTLEQYYMSFEQNYANFDTVVEVLIRSSLLDEKFGQTVGFCYCIEVDEINIRTIAQIYIFAEFVFVQLCGKMPDKRSYFMEIVSCCRKNLEFHKREYGEQLEFLKCIATDQLVSSPSEKQPSEQLTNPLEIQCKQRNTLLQQVQKFIGSKMDEMSPQTKQMNLMVKCLQNGPESSFGMSNQMKDLILGQLVQCYKGVGIQQTIDKLTEVPNKTIEQIIFLALLLNHQGQQQEAVTLLSNEMYKEGQPKNIQQLFMHNIAKLNFVNNEADKAIGILQLLQEQYDQLYFNSQAVSLDYVLCLYGSGNIANVEKALSFTKDKVNLNINYKLLYIMMILQIYQSRGVSLILQESINLSEFDLVIFNAADALYQIVGDISPEISSTLNAGYLAIMKNLEELMAYFTKPPIIKLQYNHFNLSLVKQSEFQKCLLPEVGQLSILCSDCFDTTQVVLFYVSILVILAICSQNESTLKPEVIKQFLKCVVIEPSHCQNIVAFLLMHNEYELSIQLLERVKTGRQDELAKLIECIKSFQAKPDQQFPEYVFNIASDTQTVTVQAGPFYFGIVIPVYPVTLPAVLDKQIFNPLNQFSFSFFIDQYIDLQKSDDIPNQSNKKQVNFDMNPMTCVMLFDFYGYMNDAPKYLDNQEPQNATSMQHKGGGFRRNRNLTADAASQGIKIGSALDNTVVKEIDRFDEVVSRPDRAPSARPLLKQDKKMFGGVVGGQRKLRPIRKFRE